MGACQRFDFTQNVAEIYQCSTDVLPTPNV